MKFFSVNAYKGFDEGPKSFYTVYGKLFATLEEEEESAIIHDVESLNRDEEIDEIFTNFGGPHDKYEDLLSTKNGPMTTSLKDFYAKWTHFATRKSFRHMDKWKLSDAPDRRVRRLMEKDNKKARELARREFSDTVRNLASYVRKRDPRVIAYVEEQKKRAELKAKEEKEKMNREKQDRIAEAENYIAPSWAMNEDIHVPVTESEDEIEEDLFCVACNRSFKSESAFENHEASKKHLKMVAALRREMLLEDEELGEEEDLIVDEKEGEEEREEEEEEEFYDANETIDSSIESEEHHDDDDDDDDKYIRKMNNLQSNIRDKKKKKRKSKRNVGPAAVLFSDHDEELTEELSTLHIRSPDKPKLQNITFNSKEINEQNVVDADENDDDDDGGHDIDGDVDEESNDTITLEGNNDNIKKDPVHRTNGRRKEKKKKGTSESNTGPIDHRCNVCGVVLNSRTKLFDHIRESGHASAKVEISSSKSKKKVSITNKRNKR